jgi:hypothetical protein
MRANTGLIAGLVVSLLLAAVFAVLWYGAYEDNKLLTRKVIYLTHQLEGNLSLLQKTTQQLAETQKQLQDTQNQLEQTQKQLKDAQAQLSQAKAQLSLLETQKNQLVNQLTQLNATYQQLRNKVYASYYLVQQAKALLNKITLNAPQVGDVWTFTRTYTYTYNPLPSGYSFHLDLSLYSYQTVEVSADNLFITFAFYTPDQYEAWLKIINNPGAWRETSIDPRKLAPLAFGTGYVKFTPPSNGTYVLEISSPFNDGRFQVTYRYSETWHYYDIVPSQPVTPYVMGTPRTPSRDFFRLFAIYNYWLENRRQLANEVMRQLNTTAFSLLQQLLLETHTLYALSLVALLKNAGFNVSLAAIGTYWGDPFSADSIIPVVRFNSLENSNATFLDMYKKIHMGWINVMWVSRSSYGGYDFYVVIDTYNVVDAVDRQLDTRTPFNVIYVDGLTKLPEYG